MNKIPTLMKAVFVERYGGPEVLKIKEVKTPRPGENEVLVKIYAAAVNVTDPVFRKGKPFVSRFFTGLIRPKHPIPGDVFAGEVVEAGNRVTRFRCGDRVFGYSTDTLGAHAEYKCLSQDAAMVAVPAGVEYDEASGMVDGGLTALVFLRDRGEIEHKRKVLINGASGSIGTAAVQLAVLYGAEVTGVCSASNRELVMALGATRVIDYSVEDFTKVGERYDLVFDTVAKSSFAKCKNILTDDGIYLTTFPTAEVMLRGLFQSKTSGQRARFVAAGIMPVKEKVSNLIFLAELLKNKKITTVIDRTYLLDQIADAHEYVEAGHKKGNVVLVNGGVLKMQEFRNA